MKKNRLPCFGKYNNQSFLCTRLCRSSKCERETVEMKQSKRLRAEQYAKRRLALNRTVHNMEEASSNQSQSEERPSCFGSYDDSYACGACRHEFRQECFQIGYGVSSSVSFIPAGSSFSDTGATPVGGGSEENMDTKDLATRTAKAQGLEVVPVGDDFMVKSSTRQGGYMVTSIQQGDKIGYHCACMDFATHRGDKEWKCKHIIAVGEYLEKRGPSSGDSRYDIIDI